MFALITGGSKGIGKEIALELAKRKYNLLLVARSESELETTAKEISERYEVNVFTFPCDLSEKGAARKVLEWVESNKYPIEILVNNAGYGIWGYFEKLSLEEQMKMLQVNNAVLVELTYLFIPILSNSNKSYILNVASTAAYQAVPALSLYAASKAFVLLFTRGLRHELKRKNISVSCLSPGATSTNFTNRAGMQAMEALAEKFSMKADAVAKIAVKGLFKGKAEIIPGFSNWFSVKAIDFLPKSLIENIAASLYTKHLK